MPKSTAAFGQEGDSGSGDLRQDSLRDFARISSRVAIVAGAFMAVFLARYFTHPYLGSLAPYLGFLFAVIVATRLLGWLSGLICMTLAVLIANYTFHEGGPGLGISTPGAAAQVLLFILTSLLLIAIDHDLVSANARLAREADVRRAAEEEARELALTLEQRVMERTRELETSVARAADLNLELERRAAELKAAMGELESFSYSVSHDLKAPLRTINGQIGMLLEDAEGLTHSERETLERVRRGARKMADLTDDLLQLSKVGRSELRLEDVGLTELVRDSIATESARQPRDRSAIELEEGVVVRADRRLLEIVVDNLVHNAWKFSANKPTTVVRFFVADADGVPCFCIEDEGAGFEEAQAGGLFDPFVRLHNDSDFDGTGIGLATVRKIVERHGGRIWAHGTVDRGARFCFTLGTMAPGAGAGARRISILNNPESLDRNDERGDVRVV